MSQQKLNHGKHSVYLLTYHLVLVIKHRRKVITEPIAEHLKTMLEEQLTNNDAKLIEFGYEADHVHIVFSAPPHLKLSSFINAYKSSTSRIIKKLYPEVRLYLWKEHFWSRSYCLLTTGGAPLEIIKKYVSSQKGDAS